MKLSDWLPSVFVEGDGDDIQVTTKKFSQFPTVTGEGVQGVGVRDGNNVKFDLTTDAISVNPNQFRNDKGQFIGTPEELAQLKNQRDVNEFFYNAISDIEMGDVDLEGYATEAQLNEVDRTAIMRDDALKKEHDEDHTKQSVINAGVVVRLDELFWRDVEIDQLTRDGDKALQEQIDTNKDASESGDSHLQQEIDELALAVNTILLKHDSGKWKYIGPLSAGPPRKPGELSIVDSMDSTENVVAMHSEDLDGKTHFYADVDPGDYMELVNVNDPQQYILYVVTEIFDGAVNMLEANVSLKRRSGGDFAPDDELEVRYYQINEQDIALEELDDRFVNVSGGDTMDGPLIINKPTEVALDIIGDGGNSKVKFWSSGAIALQDYTSFKDNELVTKQYVDTAINNSGYPLPKFKLMTMNDIDEWDIGIPSKPGDLAFLNTGNIATLSLSLTRSIVFAGRSLDGGRYARDKDAKDFKRAFGTNFNVLDESGEKTIMSMSGSHNALCEVGYLGSYDGVFYDMYQITWQSPSSTSVNSDIDMWEVGKTYRLHIPELFY